MTDSERLFIDLAAPGVRGLRPYEPGKPIEELEREYGVRHAVKLASNENSIGPSPRVLDAVKGQLAELARYPDGNGFALKQALAERHAVAAGQITLGNGSNDVLDLLARAFLTPADEVVFSEHAFAVYPIVTQAAGAQAVVAPAVRDGAGGMRFGHDLDAMRTAVGPRTRLVFIANPNNPTGTWLAREPLEGFVSTLPPHVLVVIDEAYFEYARDQHDAETYPECVPWVERYPNLVVTRTFSKAYGLAGLRVGYAISQPAIAELLNRVRQPFNVNSLALTAAVAALQDAAHLRRALEVNRAGLSQLHTGLRALAREWIASAGNFLCVDVGRSAAEVYQALLREGVIVRPVSGYGLPNHLRVTVGLPEENTRFLKALGTVLESR